MLVRTGEACVALSRAGAESARPGERGPTAEEDDVDTGGHGAVRAPR